MKVSVYSTATCPYCVKVKQWLDSKSVTYDDVRVDTDQAAAIRMVQLSGQMGVPFTTIEDDSGKLHGVLGYDVATLSQLLGVSA